MNEIPEGLISVIALPSDPDIAVMQPPAAIIGDLLDAYQGGDLSEQAARWIEQQTGLQKEAEAELKRLGVDIDPAVVTKTGLPGWITQEWSMILQMPWSHRLGEAVESAKSWK